MTQVVLFHSVLGVRHGIHDAAERLRAAGHNVMVADLYHGQTFDSYAQANGFERSIGFPELMTRALATVEDLPDGFVVAGFSNGCGISEYIATQRNVAGILLLSGALPLEMLSVSHWPASVAAQMHHAKDDPFGRQEWRDTLAASIRAAGATLDVFEYPGTGHLFTDPSLPDEYQPQETELLWDRMLAFAPLATA